MSNDAVGKWIFIGCCIGAAIFLLANGLACSPADCSAFWLGDAGFIGSATGVATLAAVIVASLVAMRTFRLNQEIDAATRFQRAVELIGSSQSGPKIGGIWSAMDVAKQYPSSYLRPVFKVLQATVAEDGTAMRDRSIAAKQISGKWAKSELAHVQAVIALTHVPNAHRWPDEFTLDGYAEIFGAYLAGGTFRGLNFNKLHAHEFFFRDVTFIDCYFAGCEISGLVAGYLKFVDCDLSGARLLLTDAWGSTLIQGGSQLQVTGGRTEGATFDHLPLDWQINPHSSAPRS